MTEVSIIIVSWNAREHLRNCVISIYESLGDGNYEIIIVDNSSTDGSIRMVKKEWPDIILVENSENLGFAKANNIGIRASTGRYVCLVNSDIVVLEDCIKKMMEFMDSNPSVGMAGPRTLNPDRTLQVSCRHFPSIWNNLCQVFGFNKVFPKLAWFSEPMMKYWFHDTERKVDVLTGCFWVVRREAIDQVGLLDENFFFYGEDVDWCKRFHDTGWDVKFYPGAEAIHFGGASSSNAPIKFYLEMQKADLQYWRKHHGRLGQLAYWMIILLRQLVRIPIYALKYIFLEKRRETAQFKLKRSLVCIQWLFTYKKG